MLVIQGRRPFIVSVLNLGDVAIMFLLGLPAKGFDPLLANSIEGRMDFLCLFLLGPLHRTNGVAVELHDTSNFRLKCLDGLLLDLVGLLS